MRLGLILAVLGIGVPSEVWGEDLLSAVRAGHWAEAQAAAAVYADPVAAKLVRYFRILSPGAAGAAEISDFIKASPDWPDQALLARRRDEALANEPDDTFLLELCGDPTIELSAALSRCSEALRVAGQIGRGDAMIRHAWVNLSPSPGDETRFMQRWGHLLNPEDQRERFDRLAWTDPSAATRQSLRMDAVDRPQAAARLALRRDEPGAAVLLAALTPSQRENSGLFLEHVRWQRRAGHDDEALALWTLGGAAAEEACPSEHLPLFWAERSLLARRRLRIGDNAGAYALADGHRQRDPEQVADAEFLAGFIALRWLDDAAAATHHFMRLNDISTAAITAARAQYWLGRAKAVRHGSANATLEYSQAARLGTTYYGQLAAFALGQTPAGLAANLAGLRDPTWTDEQAVEFSGRELTRAAGLLVAFGDQNRVRRFLLRLEELAADDADRALTARLATGWGPADLGVAIARRAGRDGVMLPVSGWPIPASIVAALPAGRVPTSLALGIIRQESSFNTNEVSPAGARGLMQLMPGTAKEVGSKLGLSPSLPALTADPALNIALGTTYLRSLLDRFGGSVPLAAAAYNAGPGRVQDWLISNGDPRTGPIDMIDWIELIPLSETRNYVQRVIENVMMYAAKQGDQAPVSLVNGNPSEPERNRRG